MSVPARYREAIVAVRPDLAAAARVLHAGGWDSDAVEAGGFIFKFPKHADAPARLRREAKFLALIAARVPLAVPRMTLHEAPVLFSEHRMIPGGTIVSAQYDVLSEAQRDRIAGELAAFYAALHAIPRDEARAAGAEAKPEWPEAAEIMPVLRDRLPERLVGVAERVLDAYAALPAEPEIFGYFDGHGWNMAFDHERRVLNGVYDFADAAIGPLTREFVYSNLISADLPDRIIDAYERLTGASVDRRIVAIRTSVQHLSELAELPHMDESFAAAVVSWIDSQQSRPQLAV